MSSETRRTFLALILVASLAVCAISTVRAQKEARVASQGEAGIAKLQAMACKLRLGMSRQEVERQLGKPAYCPSNESCNYSVDAKDEEGIPFGLVVRYVRSAYKEGEQEKQTGKLEEYWVGRIAE